MIRGGEDPCQQSCLYRGGGVKKAGLDELASNRGGSKDLRILTVDQAQGSEADIVVLSCVRSNLQGNTYIGFVGNFNRANVAVSRARERVVIGDGATMRRSGSKLRRTLFEQCAVFKAASEMPGRV